VEAFSATLGKILPSGKFGKTPSLEAAFWNIHPASLNCDGEFLTDWKNNSRPYVRRPTGVRRNEEIIS
jgi:hypothetical protein